MCDRELMASHEQHDDVYEKQADKDEGEVDKELLQVTLGLWVYLDVGRPADGGARHVLHSLHSPCLAWTAGGRRGLKGSN